MTPKNLRQVLIRIAQGLLLVFPLFLALILQIREVVIGHFSSYSFWMTVPFTLTLTGFLFYLNRAHEITRRRSLIELCLIISTFVSIRLFLLAIFSSDLSSDFLDIHNFAVDIATGQGIANTGHYTYIPRVTYLNITALFLSFFYRIFGTSIRVDKMVMVALSAFAALGMYFTAKNAFHSHRTGLVAVLLFAFLPSLVVYTGITTPEHATILFILLVFFALTYLEQLSDRSLQLLLLFVLLGVLSGLADWFRPVGIVLVIAIAIAELCISASTRVKDWLLLGARIIVLVVIYTVVANLSVTISEKAFSIRVPGNSQRMGESLYIGSNFRSGGIHSGEDLQTVLDSQNFYGTNFDAANRHLVDLAFARLNANRNAIPELLAAKFTREWAHHNQLFEYALIGSNDAELAGYLKDIDALFTPIIYIGVLASILSSFLTRPTRVIFGMQLFILGFAILLLITEAQNRYPVIVMPVLLILAADGFARSKEFMQRAGGSILRRLPTPSRSRPQP